MSTRISGTALQKQNLSLLQQQQQQQQSATAREYSISRSTVLGDAASLSRNRSSRLRIAAGQINKSGRVSGSAATAAATAAASSSKPSSLTSAHLAQVTGRGAASSSISVVSAATNRRSVAEKQHAQQGNSKPSTPAAAAVVSDAEKERLWIGELTSAAAACMRSLGSHTIVLAVRSDAVQRLLACLRRAESAVVMESTLANHSDVVLALERLVPLLAFQLRSPRYQEQAISVAASTTSQQDSLDASSSLSRLPSVAGGVSAATEAEMLSASAAVYTTLVLDLLHKCCDALRLIAVSLRQLLPVHVSASIASAVVDALLLYDLSFDLTQIVAGLRRRPGDATSSRASSTDGGGGSRSLSRHSSVGNSAAAPPAPQPQPQAASIANARHRSPSPPRSVYYRKPPPMTLPADASAAVNVTQSRRNSPSPYYHASHDDDVIGAIGGAYPQRGHGENSFVDASRSISVVVSAATGCGTHRGAAPAHLSFLRRERHPWEAAATECLAAVARAMEEPVVLVPLLVSKLRQRADLQRQTRHQRQRLLQRLGAVSSLTAARGPRSLSQVSFAVMSGGDSTTAAADQSSSVAAMATSSGADTIVATTITASSCSAVDSVVDHDERQPHESTRTDASTVVFVEASTQQQQQQNRKGASAAATSAAAVLRFFDDEEDVAMNTAISASSVSGGGGDHAKSLLFVVELILTLLEDAASRSTDRAYALFPAKRMRLSAPFIIPHGVQLLRPPEAKQEEEESMMYEDAMAMQQQQQQPTPTPVLEALQRWFAAGGRNNSVGFLRGAEMAVHLVPAATTQQQAMADEQQQQQQQATGKKRNAKNARGGGIFGGREADDDYNDGMAGAAAPSSSSSHDEDGEADGKEEEAAAENENDKPPHPLDGLEWETGDGLSDLWQFFSTLLMPVSAPVTEVQVRALALLYVFYPGDTATLVDKCWDEHDAAGRRRCLARLVRSPPFPLLIAHREMLETNFDGDKDVVAEVVGGTGAMLAY